VRFDDKDQWHHEGHYHEQVADESRLRKHTRSVLPLKAVLEKHYHI
jgi:hypothetical protein